ncbi:MAG: PASTA domain-containing protein [Oscillospiraceae bacterium]|jgi:stage V sporulation protein D (sporulation-specific penicillin-binding protein)|nr:PASTA domain-containing protein [Oscillospiraceae bacterium]
MLKASKQLPASRRANRTVLFRTFVLMALCGVGLFVPLGMKLYDIQIVNHDKYERMAVEQQTKNTVISPLRGTIFDRNYKTLAVCAGVDTVFISPADIETEDQAQRIARGLSEILDVDYDVIYEKTQKKNRQYEEIRKKIEKDLADRVRTFISDNDLQGIVYVTPDSKRYYPNGNFASHVLGFVGDDNQGLDGVEAIYDESLKGTPGRVVAARDARNRVMPFQYEKHYDAQDGLGVVLTLDETMQHFLENHLQTALVENDVRNKAAGIIMDVKTGEILAMDTQYGYDPNEPRALTDPAVIDALTGLEGEERSALLKDALLTQWRNKIVNDTYEPGSTFKIVTTAVALEENAVSLNDTFFCQGSIMVPGWSKPIHCHKLSGHGEESFLQGVQNSCNPVFITVAQRVGQTRFYDYFRAFGFTEKTGVDLPGESGSVFHSRDAFHEDTVALSTYAFGQTFNITPIQLITAVSAVANGGNLMKPHIVRELVDDQGRVVRSIQPEIVRQVISAETSRTVCEILESVVSVGTGRNANIAGYRIAGKTGTSQKRDPETHEYMPGKYVVSFVGFAPADDPQVAVLVLLDEPMYGPPNLRSGGGMAAPVVRRIMSDILPYIGIAPQYTPGEGVAPEITVPSVSGLPVADAEQLLKDRDIPYSVVGQGDTVSAQTPAAGAQVPESAEIILYLGDERPPESATVPNVVGMTAEKANRALVNAGFYMRAVGATTAVGGTIAAAGQSVEAGTQAPPGTTIEVEFLDTSLRD